MTPPGWRRSGQLGCRAEAGPHQLHTKVRRRSFTDQPQQAVPSRRAIWDTGEIFRQEGLTVDIVRSPRRAVYARDAPEASFCAVRRRDRAPHGSASLHDRPRARTQQLPTRSRLSNTACARRGETPSLAIRPQSALCRGRLATRHAASARASVRSRSAAG